MAMTKQNLNKLQSQIGKQQSILNRMKSGGAPPQSYAPIERIISQMKKIYEKARKEYQAEIYHRLRADATVKKVSLREGESYVGGKIIPAPAQPPIKPTPKKPTVKPQKPTISAGIPLFRREVPSGVPTDRQGFKPTDRQGFKPPTRQMEIIRQANIQSGGAPSIFPEPTPPEKRYDVSYVTGTDIQRDILSNLRGGTTQYKEIDPGSQYKLESGEIVSGKELRSQLASGIIAGTKGISKVSPGQYIEKGGRYYSASPELRYVLEHSEMSEHNLLYKSIGQSEDALQEAFEKAYDSLSEKEKAEYGFAFHPFTKTEPVEEWQYHPGGSEYLKEHKAESLEAYYKEVGGLENVPISMYKFASTGYAGAMENYKYKPEFLKSQAWENLTMPESEARAHYFEKLPGLARAWSSGFHATVSAAAFPITLPQAIVKWQTGKTWVLPDVSEKLARVQPGGPSGLITTGISEGVSRVTGEPTKAWSKFLKHPFSGLAATGGELLGMWMGGKAMGAVSAAAKFGIRASIRYMPKIFTKFGKFFDINKGLYTKLSKGKIYGRMYGWAKGDISKARIYRQAATRTATRTATKKPTTYDFWAKKEIFKPTRKKVWITREEVSAFKSKLKPSTHITFKVVPSRQYVRKWFLQQMEKGKLGFRKYIRTQASMEETSVIKASSFTPTKTPTTGAFYRIGPRTAEFVEKPSTPFFKSMLQKGYSYKQPTSFIVKDSEMAKFYGSLSGWVKGPPTNINKLVTGFGKSNLLQSPKFYGGKITQVTEKTIRKFLKNIEARTNLIQRPLPTLIKPKWAFGEIYKPVVSTINVPVQGGLSGIVSASALASALALRQQQAYQLIHPSEQIPKLASGSALDFKDIQIQVQKLEQIPWIIVPQETVDITVPPPVEITMPMIYKPGRAGFVNAKIKPVIPKPKKRKTKKGLYGMESPFGNIYGERTWKVKPFTFKKTKFISLTGGKK